MSGYVCFLQCVGKAVARNGARALLRLVPFGDVALDIATDAYAEYTKDGRAADLRAALEGLAQVPDDEIRRAAEEVAAEELAGQPAEVRDALAGYLGQLPASVRQSLRRPTDLTGTTIPAGLVPRNAEDLLAFLPGKLPRFRPGDQPLAGVDWRLEQLLGVGGFGEVWKARNPHLASAAPVALKFCLDPSAAAVLRNEAAVLDRVMRQGRHPGIVQLQHTYLSADTPCLEYEYVEGGDLAGLIREWHRSRGGPTPHEAARAVLRLAEIIGFAHRVAPPIVHRDLKPANILVPCTADGSGRFKVADFGIGAVAVAQAAREAGRPATQASTRASAVRGSCTPLYASPQQMRGEAPDPTDDVYALGVIWHQLLTGDLAGGRPGGSRWRKGLCDRGMPTEMVDLLESCFEDNRRDRPRDAAALAEDLSQALAGAPAAGLPPAPPAGTGATATHAPETGQGTSVPTAAGPGLPSPGPAQPPAAGERDGDGEEEDEEQEAPAVTSRAVTGAVIGALGGAFVGGVAGWLARSVVGALVGGLGGWLAGALIGALIGRLLERPEVRAEACRQRGNRLAAKGDYRRAAAAFQRAIDLDPHAAPALNSLAWLWATCPDPAFRNGKRAREYARRACELTGWKKGYILDTLAAACNECGQLREAVRWAKEALDRAPPARKGTYALRADYYQAMLWSGDPEPQARNGPKAVEYARRCCELSSWKKAPYLDALAAAHAECGRFAEAVEWAQKAVELASDGREAEYRSRLDLYRAGKPYRVGGTPAK